MTPRTPRTRTRLALLPVGALVGALLLVPSGGGATAEAAGTLSVTPSRGFYAGQQLTFSGDIGSGAQTIHMERKQSPTSGWTEVYNPRTGKIFTTRTKADGTFSFTFPAFAMNGLYVRVVGKRGATTRAQLFEAAFQDVDVLFPGSDAVVGDAVPVTVQAYAKTIGGGAQPQVLTGRAVSLQRRTSAGTWSTVATGAIDSSGEWQTTVTPTSPGDVTYRARLDDWTEDGDQIGWFPSFPTTLTVVSARSAGRPATVFRTPAQRRAAAPAPFLGRPVLTDGRTAASHYGWGGALWDYAWELGESLSSPAYRGTSIRGGTWNDRSTGTGRVVKYGGGLEFQTGEPRVPGDYGTTSLTLEGKPDRVGRWEVRERYRSYSGGTPFDFAFELVPESQRDEACPSTMITVARAATGESSIQLGIERNGQRWSRTLSGYRWPEKSGRLYAVEVTSKKVTFFVNGTAVASTTVKGALPKVPLTPRMRVIGADSPGGMAQEYVLIDWLRHFSLQRGTKAPAGVALKKASGSAC